VAAVARKLLARGLIAAGIAASAVAAAGPSALATPALAAAAGPAASSPDWTATPLPNPPGVDALSFQPAAISCSSATDCTGGGSYFLRSSPNSQTAALLTLTGTTWAAAPAPLPADAAPAGHQHALVASVSCPSAASCFAGGNYAQSPGASQGMLLTRSGGKWSAMAAPVPANAGANPVATVFGMSCLSATWCTAVGGYSNGGTGSMYGLLLRWSGGKWTAASAPVPADSDTVGGLEAVSCPSAARCFAGGWQDAAGDTSQQPVLLTWSN
jgi:hypothetical protein